MYGLVTCSVCRCWSRFTDCHGGDGPDNDWFDRAEFSLTALIVRAGDRPDNDGFERAVSGRGMGLLMTITALTDRAGSSLTGLIVRDGHLIFTLYFITLLFNTNWST